MPPRRRPRPESSEVPADALRTLARLRARIDALDRALARLARDRLAAVRRIAALKRRAGLPPFDEAREASIRAVYRKTLRADAALARELPDALLGAGRRAQRR